MKSTHGQAVSCQPRTVHLDDGLEYIMWMRDLGEERLIVASYALHPNQKNCLFFAIVEGSRTFVVCFLHTSGEICFCRTRGRSPPQITSHRVNTVTLGWVGALSERGPFRFYDAIAVFVDRCRGRGLSPFRMKHTAEFFSGRSCPKIRPGFLFSVISFHLDFFLKIRGHTERAVHKYCGVHLRNSNFL